MSFLKQIGHDTAPLARFTVDVVIGMTLAFAAYKIYDFLREKL